MPHLRIAIAGAIVALAALAARAEAAALQFYNAQTGATAAGTFGRPGIDDTFHQWSNTGTFSPGWTYVVQVPYSKYVFAFNAATGAAATASFDINRRYVTAKSYPAPYFTTGWTSVVGGGAKNLVFYRSGDGLAAVAHVADDGSVSTTGSYVTPRPHPPLTTHGVYPGRGWSSVTATDNGMFFYNRQSGEAQLGGFGETFVRDKDFGAAFSPGWSRIVYLESGSGLSAVLVYYNASSGSLAIGKLDLGGNHTTLRSYRFTPGFTSVVAMQSPWTTNPPTPSQVFFYNLSDGSAALATVTDAGGVTFISFPAGKFSPGWTSITYGP